MNAEEDYKKLMQLIGPCPTQQNGPSAYNENYSQRHPSEAILVSRLNQHRDAVGHCGKRKPLERDEPLTQTHTSQQRRRVVVTQRKLIDET